jgi:hypothetical protein
VLYDPAPREVDALACDALSRDTMLVMFLAQALHRHKVSAIEFNASQRIFTYFGPILPELEVARHA